MSETINKILASTAQAFSTAEQKQARDNIAAQASGDYLSASTFNTFSAHIESAKQEASAMSAYVPFSAISADANSAITSINGSSVGTPFTGVSAGNCISGDGSSSSPLGLSATAQWTGGANWYPMTEISAGYLKISAGAFAGAQIYQNESSFCNWNPTGITVRHSASGVGGGNIDNFYGEIINLNYNAGQYYLHHISSDASGLRAKQNGNPNNVSIFGFGSAAFSDDNETTLEVVDPASIRRWNSQSASGWAESGNSLSTGFGGNQATAASQYNDGAGNWAARTVKMSGLPDQTLYGFQSRPAGTGSYLVNAAGAFVAPDLPTFNLKVYKPTTAPIYLSTGDYPVMSNTADGVYVIVNLGSGPNVVYPDSIGATASIPQNNSAQLIWDSEARTWVRWNN